MLPLHTRQFTLGLHNRTGHLLYISPRVREAWRSRGCEECGIRKGMRARGLREGISYLPPLPPLLLLPSRPSLFPPHSRRENPPFNVALLFLVLLDPPSHASPPSSPSLPRFPPLPPTCTHTGRPRLQLRAPARFQNASALSKIAARFPDRRHIREGEIRPPLHLVHFSHQRHVAGAQQASGEGRGRVEEGETG